MFSLILHRHITHTLIIFFNLVACCSKKEEILCKTKDCLSSFVLLYIRTKNTINNQKQAIKFKLYIAIYVILLAFYPHLLIYPPALLFSEEPQLATRSKAMAPHRKPKPHRPPLSWLLTDTLCN